MSGLEEQGLGAESEDLFRAAKKALSPSMADRDRVRARLALKIGVGAAVATVATTSSKAAASAAGAGAAGAAATKTTAAAGIPLFAKIIAPLVIASAVGTVAVAPHVVSRASTTTTTATATAAATTLAAKPPPPVFTNAKADPAPAAAAVSIDDLPNAETSPRAPLVRTAPKAASRAQPTDDTSEEARAREEEAALALQIDAALRANDTARAARLADEHQRRFPKGLLTEEREGARVLIRCSSTPNGAIASEFLQAHPRSPMRARILAACATERGVE